MKKILFTLFFIFSFFMVSTSEVQAAKTFSCTWTGIAGKGTCQPSLSSNCDLGTVVDPKYCNTRDKASCDSAPATNCIVQSCTNLGGKCKTSCNSGERNFGDYECATSGKTCCSPKLSGLKGITCGDDTINTAIGCIPVGDSNEFISFLLGWAFGIGGGIAFLLIALSSFQIMTSAGDPKKLQAGKELLTSAISGLLLLIFGVFILKVIGIDILGLDEFGFGKTN